MKRITTIGILTLFLALAFSVSSLNLEAKQPVKKTQVNKKATSTKKKQSEKPEETKSVSTQKSNTSKKKNRPFEGQLMYVTNEYANKMAKVFSFGTLYDGNRVLFVTIKGNEFDLYDASLHQHTIMKPEKREAVIYSELTREGITYTGFNFDEAFKMFYNDGTVKVADKVYRRDLNSVVRDGMETYKGDQCKVYSGTITQAEVGDTPMMEILSELWYVPELSVSKYLNFLYFGFNPPGVVKKGIINYNARVSLIGSFKMQQALELVGINERKVDNNELQAPGDIALLPFSAKNSFKYLRAHNKALKKAGLKPEKKKVKEIKEAIAKDWEFAYNWNAYSIKPPKNDYTVWQLATDILNLTNNATKIWDKSGNPTPSVFDQREEYANSEDSYYIPTLLGRLYSERNEATSNAQGKPKTASEQIKKAHNQKPQKIQYVDSYTVAQLKVSKMEERFAKEAWQFTAKEWDKRISFVENYAKKNNTDYIPKDVYDNFIHKREETLKKESAKRKQDNRDNSVRKMKKVYEDYVNQIMSLAYGTYKIDLTSLNKKQNNMRDLRKEYPELEKSPWEDWRPGMPKP